MKRLRWIGERAEVAKMGVFEAGDEFFADDTTADNLINQGCAQLATAKKGKQKVEEGE